MLTAQQAATFAAASYNVRENLGDATGDAFNIPGAAGELGSVFDIGASKAFTGSSGFGSGTSTGFGMLTPYRNRPGAFVLAIRGTATGGDKWSDGTTGMILGPGGTTCHWGFYKIYRSILPQVEAALAAAGPRFMQLDIVGHSLGGALASIMAQNFGSRKVGKVTLTTFGAPRVGSVDFNRALAGNVASGELRRIYDIADPVPMIPLFPYFQPSTGAMALPGSKHSGISPAAHSMRDNYLVAMKGGWPALNNASTRGDVSYWLGQATQNGHPFSAAGMSALGKALGVLLVKIIGVGLQNTIATALTLVDQVAYLLHRGAQAIKAIRDEVVEFVDAMLGWLGRKVLTAMSSIEKIAADFLRWVLSTFLSFLMSNATQALGRLFL